MNINEKREIDAHAADGETTIDPEDENDEEYGEPRIRLSKRLVREIEN